MSEVVNLFPVAEGGTDLAVPGDIADALIQVGNAADAGTINYLKFTKAGVWVFGRDDDEIDTDEDIAVNPMSFSIGWQGWKDGTPVNGPIVPINKAGELPAESELEAIPASAMNGWNKMLGVSLKSLDDGTVLQFNASSRGGKQAVTKLMKEVGLGLKAHPEAPVALVRLSGDEYKHPTYGKIHTPVFTVVGWADGAGKEVKKLQVA